MMRALSKHLNIDPSSNDGGLQNPVLEALLDGLLAPFVGMTMSALRR